MKATISLVVVVVVVVVASTSDVDNGPLCETFNDEEKSITVPDDQNYLDIWLKTKKKNIDLEISVHVGKKSPLAGPLMVVVNKKEESTVREDGSWCHVRLTQPVKGVNNSVLETVRGCGTSGRIEYTDDDVTKLSVTNKKKHDILVCVTPPPPERCNCTVTSSTKGRKMMCTTTSVYSETSETSMSSGGNVPGWCSVWTLQQQQVVVGTLAVLLLLALISCVFLLTRLFCNQRNTVKGMEAAERSSSQQYLAMSLPLSDTAAKTGGTRPSSTHDSENSLYGATITRHKY